MKNGQDNAELEGTPREQTLVTRRKLLELGAIGVGVGLPVVMTLVPRQARAEGSWQCVPGGQAGAQGSWSCRTGANGSGMQRSRDWKQRTNESENLLGHAVETQPGFAVPGSHDWRMRREEEEEQKRRARGEFNRFGSKDDWR